MNSRGMGAIWASFVLKKTGVILLLDKHPSLDWQRDIEKERK